MLQCFVCSPIPKVSEKKEATGQSFIRKEITTCKIGTLEMAYTFFIFSTCYFCHQILWYKLKTVYYTEVVHNFDLQEKTTSTLK